MSVSATGNKNKLKHSTEINFFETATPCGANIRVVQQKRVNGHGKPITTLHGSIKNPNGSDLKNLDQQLHDIAHPKDEFHLFDESKPQFPRYVKQAKKVDNIPTGETISSPENTTVLLASGEAKSKESGDQKNKTSQNSAGQVKFPMQKK